MPKNVRLATQKDFTGGLNLRADQFQLAPNESPDMLNMDVDPRGGLRLRRGLKPHTAGPVGGTIHSLAQYHNYSGADHVIAGYGTYIKYTTGTSWSPIAMMNTVPDPFSSTQFKDVLYLQNGTDGAVRWNGTAAARLGQDWSDDFDAPTSGNMPIATQVVTHAGHCFAANTLELGTRHPSRVRWSHPNLPEAWRFLDWADIDVGVDGDEIVAMVPFMDHLVVFKRRSMYAIFGYDTDSFQVQAISREVGAVGPQAVCATPAGVYFFSSQSGVMLYNGRGLDWQFEPMIPALDEGKITSFAMNTISMAWVKNRVWCSVPWFDGGKRTLVLDPSLGKHGSWVMYDMPLDDIMDWLPDDDANVPMASHGDRLLILEEQDQNWDDFGDGPVHIESRYTTPWFDAGEPAVRKRFRRPHLVFIGDTDDVVQVDVFRDYDHSQRVKTFYEQVSKLGVGDRWSTTEFLDPPTNTVPNPDYDPDSLTWDQGVWAAEGSAHAIQKGSSLGQSNAVQLRLVGPSSNTNWGLDSLSLTFIPRPVR